MKKKMITGLLVLLIATVAAGVDKKKGTATQKDAAAHCRNLGITLVRDYAHADEATLNRMAEELVALHKNGVPGELFQGLNKDQIQCLLGRPDHINQTITESGVHEQWVRGGIYMYFDNGIVKSYQITTRSR